MNETATLIRDADGAEVAWEATTGGLSAASTFAFYLTHWADILAADEESLRMWRRWDPRHTLVVQYLDTPRVGDDTEEGT